MVSFFEAIFLSIIQGVTEWFPISSSGHLALLQHFFGFQDFSYDIFLHLASVLALIVFFWKDLVSFFSFRREKIDYIFKIILAMIPAGIVGVLFRDYIASLMQDMFFLGVCFIFSGCIIYLTKFSRERKQHVSFFDAFIIGIFQAFALLPSVSRSGMTISSGLFNGVDSREAARFSFLLAIPALLGANIFEIKNIMSMNISYSILVVSFLLTFVTSLITIRFLIQIVQHEKFYLFGWYNVVLGIFVVGRSLF
ncbi:MAG: undecaprenyl-diphosphate phosphatase [Nanoarchaeota archaeon]